uniref:Mitogen-activated protein kinase 7-like n=1 Tax=Petromyzon marinus TaxID=7757 RepID=A0AAJ7XH17_PETMA|nr:mitogen-activated protein kinase 7-like [Petromyzon marinus]
MDLRAEEARSRLLGKYEELLRAISAERDEALRATDRERDRGLAQAARGLARCQEALGGVRAALAAVARLEGTRGHAAFLLKCTQEWQSIAEFVATPMDPPQGPSLSLVTVVPLERRLDEMLASCGASRATAAASSPSSRPCVAAGPPMASGAASQQQQQHRPPSSSSSSFSSSSSAVREKLNQLMLNPGPPSTRPAAAPPPSSPPGPRAPMQHQRAFPAAPPMPGEAPASDGRPPRMVPREPQPPLPPQRPAAAPDEDYVIPLGPSEPSPPPPLLPRVAVGQNQNRNQRPRLPVPAKPQPEQPQGVASGFDVAKPPSRNDLIMNYGFSPTLNPNSASPRLQLSRDLRSAKRVAYPQQLAPHAERFDSCPQVLAAQSQFSGRRYWEVKVEWARWCTVGVAYGSAPRKGPSDSCGLGAAPAVSWCLEKDREACVARHNGARVPGGGARANRNLRTVGVFLDWDAGILAFYDADCMELLHAFQHSFTEPLYPALGINRNDDSVMVLNLGS